jgi:hypothetical protein
MADITARLRHLEPLIEEYPTEDTEVDLLRAEPARYLLVEQNRYNQPPYWLSTFDDPVAACHYNLNQEYAEDWSIVTIVDLDTGLEAEHPITITTEVTW